MVNHLQRALTALLASAALAGCASPPSNAGAIEVRQGTIEQITPTQLETSHHAGVGAVVGGLGGLAVGSLIGSGSGRDVAEVLGAVGGAVAGNQVQKKYDQPVPALQITVRLNSGVLVAVSQPVTSGFRVGQRVYIQGSGEAARVTVQ